MQKKKMQSRMRKIGRAGISLVSASALAISMGIGSVGQAFATDAMVQDDILTCSPNPYGHSIPSYLGLNCTDIRSGSPATLEDTHYENITASNGALRWLLMGTTEYNTNPDAYMYNSVYATDGQKLIVNNNRYYGDGYSGTGAPKAQQVSNAYCALAPYGENYSGGNYSYDDAVWEMKPDIVVGNRIPTSEEGVSTTTDYVQTVQKMKDEHSDLFGDYQTPYTFDVSDYEYTDGSVRYMYKLAEVADEAAAARGKKIRYNFDFNGDGKGTAVDLAMNFEAMAKGSEGYVLSQLAKDKKSKKSIAIITANDGKSVTLASWKNGTQYAQLQNVANNYVSGDDNQTITIEELKKAPIDLICVTVGSGKKAVPLTGLDELFGKMYWASSTYAGSIAACDKGPGLTEAFPRVLGCLYPEYIDQSDWIAYMYDTVYHVKSDKIGDAVNRAMDGVRNWDVKSGSGNDYLQWSANSVADYSQKEVRDRINYGLAYLKAQGNPTDMTDTLLNYAAANQSAVADPAVTYKPNVTSGNKATWKSGTKTGMAFQSSAHINDFLHVKVDGKVIAASNYTLKSGSTIVELTPAYLETLSKGDHSIDIVSNTGTASASFVTAQADQTPSNTNTNADSAVMYRLYNPNSGEHFYTASSTERDVTVKAGWKYEGTAWTAPKKSNTPVYRLYSGTDHHYTTSAAERDNLKKVGWKDEGIGWYSDDSKGQVLYRLYNPNVDPKAAKNNSGSHHYTTSAAERDNLKKLGWKDEGTAWHGVK